jgi:hypothetical protein
MKTTFRIATQAYEFIEIEGDESDIPKMLQLQAQYSDKPLKVESGNFVQRESFTGERVLWDETNHIYKSIDGKILMGGSTYAATKGKPFNAEMMLPICSKAWKVTEDVIADIWKMNAESSMMFGNALHNALEALHKHWKDGETIKENKKGLDTNYALPKQPVIRKAVLAYIDKYGVKGLPEVLVTDIDKGMAGSIDLLHIEAKQAHIIDYKSSVMDADKIKEYNHQLSWYGKILENKGYTVTQELRMWDGDKWTSKNLKQLEVTV